MFVFALCRGMIKGPLPPHAIQKGVEEDSCPQERATLITNRLVSPHQGGELSAHNHEEEVPRHAREQTAIVYGFESPRVSVRAHRTHLVK